MLEAPESVETGEDAGTLAENVFRQIQLALSLIHI